MGQVYCALDTRLGRRVAIKVSVKQFNDRFEREARAIAALNHPHVCTLYDVGPNYLVMELLEGETLAARLRRGPLSLELTARYGAEIADALAAAHVRGIVHRDLKPGNIMLTKSGAKVLDFGLAKLVDGDNLSEQAPDLTASQAIIGTPAYMAPEQLQGKEAGIPADIFAVGLLLYEMATGERAFKERMPALLAASILSSSPPLDRLSPPQFAHIVERCLERDPEMRWHSAQDLKIELEWAAQKTAPNGKSNESGKGYPRMGMLAAASALGIALGCFLMWRVRPAVPSEEPSLSQATRLTHDVGLTIDPDISTDGRLLAYSSDRASVGESNLDIWVQQLSGGEPIRLTHDPADDHDPSFSPDSSQIVFRSERSGGGVYVIPALGGDERLIAPAGRRPRFSPDGQWVAYWTGMQQTAIRVRESRAFIVRPTGGTPMPIAPDLSIAGGHVNEWNLLDDFSVANRLATFCSKRNPTHGPYRAVLYATATSPVTWGMKGARSFR